MALISSCSRPRYGVVLLLLSIFSTLTVSCIIVIWYGMNSDRNYIHPLLTQVIPAGHCACETSTTFECSSCLTCSQSSSLPAQLTPSSHWKYQYDRDARNEGLDPAQCSAAFPGLFEDISRGVHYWQSQGALATEDLDSINILPGMARAFIYDGELHVVASRARGEDHRRKIMAVLSSIHRALVADADRASRRNIEFVFSVEDKVEDVTSSNHPVWALARTALEEAVWLMPDFGYWAWDNDRNPIGPYDQVVEKVKRSDVPWSMKEKKLVWRGKPSFAPKLRRALIEAARDQSWGDVKQVDWQDKMNVMSMEDHCKYMFIAHVEGRSYSASLKYRQACNSVIVAHKLQYIQHHHYLLVPDGPNQNYVEVERDFSDLEDKLEPLIANPHSAERIAANSVKTFRERYLTKAAEACYWRALFDGYASVWNSSVPLLDNGQRERGLRYESFVLLESQRMFDFTTGVSLY